MSVSRRAEKFGRAFSWGVLVITAVLAGDLAASALERHLQPQPEKMSVVDVGVNARSSQTSGDISGLLRSPVKDDVSETTDSDASDTSTDDSSGSGNSLSGVSLQGTLLSAAGNAAIVNEGEETLVVNEGDSYKGLILAQVSSTWVYFVPEGGGKGVRLTLETVVDPEGAEEQEVAEVKPEKAPKEASAPAVKERLSLDDIRAILNDTSKVANQVRVVPQAKDDQPYGTRIIFRQPDNVMAQLGIENDDILLSINGAPCRSVEDMYQGYMTIRNAENLEFVVDRNGAQKTIRYELAK